MTDTEVKRYYKLLFKKSFLTTSEQNEFNDLVKKMEAKDKKAKNGSDWWYLLDSDGEIVARSKSYDKLVTKQDKDMSDGMIVSEDDILEMAKASGYKPRTSNPYSIRARQRTGEADNGWYRIIDGAGDTLYNLVYGKDILASIKVDDSRGKANREYIVRAGGDGKRYTTHSWIQAQSTAMEILKAKGEIPTSINKFKVIENPVSAELQEAIESEIDDSKEIAENEKQYQQLLEKIKSNPKRKLDKDEVIGFLSVTIDFDKDFYDLPQSAVYNLNEMAKAYRYRQSASSKAKGRSRAYSFYLMLQNYKRKNPIGKLSRPKPVKLTWELSEDFYLARTPDGRLAGYALRKVGKMLHLIRYPNKDTGVRYGSLRVAKQAVAQKVADRLQAWGSEWVTERGSSGTKYNPETEQRELLLYVTSDRELMQRQGEPILKNLTAKKARGVYNRTKAIKLARYLFDNGAKKYAKEFDSTSNWNKIFSVDDRNKASKQFVIETFEDEYELGNYNNWIPKKYQKNYNQLDGDNFNESKLDELSAKFNGEITGTEFKANASDYTPERLSRLGHLVQIKIKNGTTINFDGDAFLCADARKNLWAVGKDARITKGIRKPSNGLKPLGEVIQVDYATSKKHIENGEYVRFYHELGEVDNQRPYLFIDKNGFPIIIGGNYDIWNQGIVN